GRPQTLPAEGGARETPPRQCRSAQSRSGRENVARRSGVPVLIRQSGDGCDPSTTAATAAPAGTSGVRTPDGRGTSQLSAPAPDGPRTTAPLEPTARGRERYRIHVRRKAATRATRREGRARCPI